VRWVNLTCPEREARTASAKQQLVFSKVKRPTRMQKVRDAYLPDGPHAAARAPETVSRP
jgi:hypothetical protein